MGVDKLLKPLPDRIPVLLHLVVVLAVSSFSSVRSTLRVAPHSRRFLVPAKVRRHTRSTMLLLLSRQLVRIVRVGIDVDA